MAAIKVEDAAVVDVDDWVALNQVDDWMAYVRPSASQESPQRTRCGTEWTSRAYARVIQGAKLDNGMESKVFVVRGDDGHIVSVGLFWLVPAGGPFFTPGVWKQRWGSTADFASVEEGLLDDLFDSMARNHSYVTGAQAHLFLESLHTHPDHRNRGYATAISRRGMDMADDRGWPCYLDAAPLAVPLYRRLGYEERDTKDCWRADEKRPYARPMLRPAVEKDASA